VSVTVKPTSRDEALEEAFGAPVAELYEAATAPQAPAALRRALELRSFLAMVEEQVARIRDRLHQATAVDRDMGELCADDLRMDVAWLQAALSTRDDHLAALSELLQTMPPPDPAPTRPVQFTQPKTTTTLPPAFPAPAGTPPTRRP